MNHADKMLMQLFGEGKDLDPFQMCMRTVVVFVIALIFIRISGKRSFGMRMPMDNVVTILLGAMLSRAIVGASPFFATILASFVFVILYRLFASLGVYNKLAGRIIKGKSSLIYKDGILFEDNMKKNMVTVEDLMEEIRINSNLKSLDEVESAYVERNGEISIVKKNR